MGCHSGKQTPPVAVPHSQSNPNRRPATPPPMSPVQEEGDPSKTLLLSRRYSPSDQITCGAKFPPPGTEGSFDPKLDAAIANVAAEDTSPDPMEQVVRVSREDASSSLASSSSTRSDGQDGVHGLPNPQVPRLCEVWEQHYQHHQVQQGRGAHRGASAARHVGFRNDSPPSSSLYVETVPEAGALGIVPFVEGPSDLCRDSENASTCSDSETQEGPRGLTRNRSCPSSAIPADRVANLDSLGPSDAIASADISGFGRLSYREEAVARPGDCHAPKAVKMSRGFANDDDDDDTAIVPEDAAWSGVAGHFEYIAARSQDALNRSQEALNTACCGNQARWQEQIIDPFCTQTGVNEQPSLAEVSAFLGSCCTLPSTNRPE